MDFQQKRLYEMFRWFHDYCEENGIRYYAIGGTLLGAIRHEGFIPWDDDIDLGLPREDYNKLLSIFTKPIDGYMLESPYNGKPDFLYTYCKLYDQSTTLIEKGRYICKRGIYIDIFPIDAIGRTEAEARKTFKRFDRMNMFLMMRTCAIRKERKWYKNAAILAARLIPKFLINERSYALKIEEYSKNAHNPNNQYIANMHSTYRDKEIINKDLFGNPILHKFEDSVIYVPEKSEEYLTHIYGNWKQLPPEAKRKTAHDYVFLDLNTSYLKDTH